MAKVLDTEFGPMKFLSFAVNKKRKYFELLAKFRPKDNPFTPLKHLLFRYLRRLLKELVFLLTLFFLGILIFNFWFPKSSFEKIKENFLLYPDKKQSHLLLSLEFQKANDLETAAAELRKFYELEESLELRKIESLKNQPAEIRTQILAWQKIVNLNPDYRDGYLKLSILNLNLSRKFDAKRNLDKAIEIDPVNETARKLRLFAQTQK
jgi:tetratricopeptide (TPR) repeat protein